MIAKPEQKETVNVSGKNYIVEDLSDKSKYFLGQLQDLGQQQQLSRARLHQIEMAISGFEKEFENSLIEVVDDDPPLEGPLANKVQI